MNSRKPMACPMLDTEQWFLQFAKIRGPSAMCFYDNVVWLSEILQTAALERTVPSVFAVKLGDNGVAFRGRQEVVSSRPIAPLSLI